jgi:hypothetical protein
MATRERVKRLRELVEQIERLPVSPDRDRLLNEVRSRAVDVDTGVTPRAILPMREPVSLWASAPVLPGPPKRQRATSSMRLAPPPPAPRVESARAAWAGGPASNLGESFCMDDRLSLGDSPQLVPLPYVQGRGGRAIPPWTLGLRG